MKGLPIDACTAGLILRSGDHPASQVVWSSFALPNCRRTDTLSIPVREILGDSLPEAHYYLDPVLLIDSDTLHFVGGRLWLSRRTLPETSDRSSLVWTGNARLEGQSPRELVGSVTVENTGSEAVRLNFGSCGHSLRIYPVGQTNDAALWYSGKRLPGEVPIGCFGTGVSTLIGSGELRAGMFESQEQIHRMFRGGIPPGEYDIAIKFQLDSNTEGQWEPDTLLILAGRLMLDDVPEVLPNEREIGGLRYSADVGFASVDPDTLRVVVRVANATDTIAQVGLGLRCVALVHGYRSREARDSAPRVEADWYRYAGDCWHDAEWFLLLPNSSWEYYGDVALQDVADEIPDGRYFIAVLLNTNPAGLVSAGEIVVSRQATPEGQAP